MDTLPRWLIRLTQAGILLALAGIVTAFLAGLLEPKYSLKMRGMPGVTLSTSGTSTFSVNQVVRLAD